MDSRRNGSTSQAGVALALLLACLSTGIARADDAETKTVANALIALQSHRAAAVKLMGDEGAQSLGQRLANDLEDFDDPTPPTSFSQADYDERLRNLATLDSSIVDQVLAGKRTPLAGVHGLAERLIVSTVDHTWQPLALYVPQPLGPRPSLVVLLHGNPQTETELLGEPYFRTLADATNTVIAAPWGRGHYDFWGPASDDAYQTAAEVAAAYGIDARRVFLAGYSMGGFSVFKIGPTHGDVWAAVLCISGAILNSETASVLRVWRSTRMYVVNGKLDTSIPAKYGQMTAQWLAGQGIPAGFYQEPTGTHMVPTMLPSLASAWKDMIAGVVRNTPVVSGSPFMTPPPMIPDDSALKP